MKFRKNIRIAAAITIMGILGVVGRLGARENITTSHHRTVQRTTAAAAQCQPAVAAIDMQINNVRARLMTGGDMWWNIGEQVAEYEIPIGSGKSSQFAASCWIGGLDQQGQLKVAAQTYRQDGNDYWPGALNSLGKIAADTCNLWDRFWQVDGATINQFISLFKSGGSGAVLSSQFDVIRQWPAAGNSGALGSDQRSKLTLNPNFTYAAFKDLNGNGKYEPNLGEYPVLESDGVQSVPDELIWWVFNDAGNVKQQSLTAAIGVEVQTSAFAYATQDFLNNATFCNYRVINRGSLTIDSTYLAVWDDCDLGWYYDDFIGCDTSRGLGIQYNGTNDDGAGGGHPVNSYGPNPPQVGLDFFQGPKRPIHRVGLPDTVQQLGMTNFTYYNNDASIIGNPVNGVEIYFYMTGSIRTGQRFSDDFQGPGVPSKGYGSGPVSNFVFWGDPGNGAEWSECACNNNPGDRRFIFSSGPFQLLPGAINDITFGCVWAKGVGGCPSTSFKTIKNIDDQAQALFDNHFKTVEGPEAPRMVIRELDRKFVMYLVNDYGSNNYGENYGNASGTYADSLQYHQPVVKADKISTDTLYKFQGYRVFQLANSQVSTDEIFNATTGEVDPTVAAEVFECDIHDSVTQIVNYVKNIQISDTTSVPQIKVVGKDSGIVHSFELQYDQFATGSDKRFVNYQTYYFVAIAYAYNNFANFDPRNIETTQDVPYLGSGHSAGLNPIPIYTAMPNPANGAMGTVINSDYGSGITVTRVEGMGNGGNDVELDAASEATALANGTVGLASYKNGQGPINVKVVDPVLVPAYNWILQVTGPTNADTGVTFAGGWKLTALQGSSVKATIYSEQDISSINEQIVEQYGISVTVAQVKKPGVNQAYGNGYITSDITFNDPSHPWLYGVKDQSDSSFANWLRAGNNQAYTHSPNPTTNPCNFNDYTKRDTNSNYENMFANFSPTQSTWGPYALAAAYNGAGMHAGTGTQCGFQVAYSSVTQSVLTNFETLPDVNLVFTPDKTKWTRCVVIEEQEDSSLAEGKAPKFYIRRHAGWNGDANGNTPIYSQNLADYGMSWFPGYAIDQQTGNRLNIIFGEDSYLGSDNGNDMIWNPSPNEFSTYDGSILFGGKHIVYIFGTKYDKDSTFISLAQQALPTNTFLRTAYTPCQWVGVPLLNPLTPLRTLQDGIIPDTTWLRFRVNRPYDAYPAVTPAPSSPVAYDSSNAYNPYYTFSTASLAPTLLSDTSNRSQLLSKIYAVPNPYYGYSGYEVNRFDTKVRIINLPAQVTIHIYALDGSLIRTLTKNDPNTSYLDWDIKNTAGLPIASGMYLMDVQAVGIGETVLKWFGATRPIDVTSY